MPPSWPAWPCSWQRCRPPPRSRRRHGSRFRLTWDDLPPLVAGNKVSTVLATGERLQGRALEVTPNALVLRITKTSDRHAFPKGQTAVPRSLITELRVTKWTGNTWRVVGTAIGAGVGLAVGGPVLALGGTAAASAAGGGFLGGAPVLGFLAGWVTDRKVTHIEIVPDSKKTGRPEHPRAAANQTGSGTSKQM